MPSYEHQQIARLLKQLTESPENAGKHADWMRAKPQVELLEQNERADEIILFASAPPTFIHTVIASESDVTPPNHDDLLEWSTGPYTSRAGYAYSTGPEGESVWFENYATQPTNLLQVQNLVFGRDREGIDDDDPTYYELLQEFTHAAELHWRADQRAYCRIDENGDLEPVVSITKRSNTQPVTLITCKREPLELFLALTDQVLVRFYDVTVLNRDRWFTSWENGVRETIIASEDLFYDQCVHPDGHALTRGVQILRRLLPKRHLLDLIAEPPSRRANQQYARFAILDWRHGNVATVSAHPEGTTSYFDAPNNDLPYEVSPAFFRPEVLSKYKADRSKYVVDELGRSITCRTTWHLKGYDINKAGQVFAYICYLRSLPYQEQLHWQSHNEEPKASISQRALENDIKGEWTNLVTPLERLVEILKQWNKAKLDWWNVPNEEVLLRLNTPVANNRDEWAEAFLEIAQTVIEKFRPQSLREILHQRRIAYGKDDRSLMLLEKLLAPNRLASGRKPRLDGLREALTIRNKARAHDAGKQGIAVSQAALMEHGTYQAHFEHVCTAIADELEEIAACISEATAATPAQQEKTQ